MSVFLASILRYRGFRRVLTVAKAYMYERGLSLLGFLPLGLLCNFLAEGLSASRPRGLLGVFVTVYSTVLSLSIYFYPM